MGTWDGIQVWITAGANLAESEHSLQARVGTRVFDDHADGIGQI